MDTSVANPEQDQYLIHEDGSSNGEDVQDAESVVEVLARVDLDLSCSSEKFVNLQMLIMHLLAWDNDLDQLALGNSSTFPMPFEKALEFDLLSGILDSEVREVEQFMDNIQAEIFDARDGVFSCRHLKKLFVYMKERIQYLEESFSKCQEQCLEVKVQSAKLKKTFSDFRVNIWNSGKAVDLASNGQLFNGSLSSKRLTAEQQRQAIRMLEKCLTRELDLEKKLSEARRNEEQLNVKLLHMEQVALRMEEASEVILGRFLEADNKAEVLMGISKDMVGRLQVVQFNLSSSYQREAELRYRLHHCQKQLEDKGVAINKLKSSVMEHVTRSSEVPMLMEKVKSLEERLRKSELCVSNADALNYESQEQLIEMENIVDSLKESLNEAENRAESVEAKVEELTVTNLELTEEINDLKGSRDSDRRKVSLLEKQVRELEIQLKHSRVSSEASQEQQNMLYTAIWDMEKLIEDLKSKLSVAESKTEGVEEHCQRLSDANLELEKETSFLRSRVNMLQASLDQENNLKAASAKEINLRTQLLMETVTRLAKQREQIHNQLISPAKQKMILVEKLIGDKTGVNGDSCNHGNGVNDCSLK